MDKTKALQTWPATSNTRGAVIIPYRITARKVTVEVKPHLRHRHQASLTGFILVSCAIPTN